jgi:hypothetical protein
VRFDSILTASIANPEPCCERCNPKDPTHCCDICDPEFFESTKSAIEANTPTKPIPKPRKKKFADEAPQNSPFKTALREWRKKIGDEVYGADNMFADGSFLMSDTVFSRLLELHHSNVHDLQKLREQCDWSLWSRYGDRLINEVFSKHKPVPTGVLVNSGVASASSSKGINKCGFCQQPGHNRMSFMVFS